MKLSHLHVGSNYICVPHLHFFPLEQVKILSLKLIQLCRFRFLTLLRSSHWQIFFKIDVLKNLVIRKAPVLESLFKKVDGLKEKRLQHRYFPVNIAKVLRTTFLQNASGRLFSLLGKLHIIQLFLQCTKNEVFY